MGAGSPPLEAAPESEAGGQALARPGPGGCRSFRGGGSGGDATWLDVFWEKQNVSSTFQERETPGDLLDAGEQGTAPGSRAAPWCPHVASATLSPAAGWNPPASFQNSLKNPH